MKFILPALRWTLFMTLVLGLIYPVTMTGISQVLFPQQALGEFLSQSGKIVGAKQIGQKFEKEIYFWSRPSAVDYNPLPSGGSNLGLANADLKKVFEERKAKLKLAHPDQTTEPPQDLLFASASGLDPHISPAAAEYQMQRVAKARNMSLDQVQSLVHASMTPRQLGILGEPVVNVLILNLSLDQAQSANSTSPSESSKSKLDQ